MLYDIDIWYRTIHYLVYYILYAVWHITYYIYDSILIACARRKTFLLALKMQIAVLWITCEEGHVASSYGCHEENLQPTASKKLGPHSYGYR